MSPFIETFHYEIHILCQDLFRPCTRPESVDNLSAMQTLGFWCEHLSISCKATHTLSLKHALFSLVIVAVMTWHHHSLHFKWFQGLAQWHKYSPALFSPSCLQRASAHYSWIGVCTHPLDLMPMCVSVQTWNWIRFHYKNKLDIVSWRKLFTPAAKGQELILKGSLQSPLYHFILYIKASALC